MTPDISELLRRTARRHGRLCPRQILGVRMGLAGLRSIGLGAPLSKTTGLIIVETYGCFVDGIEVSTGASLGHRTLRLTDIGKIAATFVDVQSGRAVRLAARPDCRERARAFAPNAADRYAAQLEAYAAMPDRELFSIQDVGLDPPVEVLLGRAGVRVTCDSCGEEILNERELQRDLLTLCQTCAGGGYYRASCEPVKLRVLEGAENREISAEAR